MEIRGERQLSALRWVEVVGWSRRSRKLLPMPTHARFELKPKPKMNETQTAAETKAETATERSAARGRNMRKF